MKKINKLISSIAIGASAIGMSVPMIASLASCGQSSKYAKLAETLQNDAIDIFKNVTCKHRHGSGNLRNTLDDYKKYVTDILGEGTAEDPIWHEDMTYQDKAKADGTDPTFFKGDKYGNVYFDIPASKGCEKWDAIILQGHVDMVETVAHEGAAFAEPIEIQEATVDGKKVIQSKDKQTSLGADNGAGIALMLSMLKNKDNFQHGKIRCLLVADEEPGMVGAGYVDDEWLAGFSNLINVDDEEVGEIVISCAGGYSKEFCVELEQLAKLQEDMVDVEVNSNVYTLEVSGLKAAHSAEVTEKMCNGIQAVTYIINNYWSEGANIRLIQLDTPITNVTNQVVTKGVAKFASNSDYTEQDIKNFETNAEAIIKEYYTDETSPVVKLTKEKSTAVQKALTSALTKKIVTLINKFLFGPISYLDEKKTILESSSNVGPIWVKINGETDKEGKAIKPISFKFYSRSCNNTIMDLIETYNGCLENGKKLPDGTEEPGFRTLFTNNETPTIKKIAKFPGWAPAANNKMRDWLSEGYKLAGITPNPKIIHGGVEPAWWIKKNPELQLASVGPTISGCHTPDETLYLDTFFEESQAILYVLDQMKK